jgi:hypothetical protein
MKYRISVLVFMFTVFNSLNSFGCTEGDTQCDARGFTQECRNDRWNTTSYYCRSTVDTIQRRDDARSERDHEELMESIKRHEDKRGIIACNLGDEKCSPSGMVLRCISRYGTEGTRWDSTYASCK